MEKKNNKLYYYFLLPPVPASLAYLRVKWHPEHAHTHWHSYQTCVFALAVLKKYNKHLFY